MRPLRRDARRRLADPVDRAEWSCRATPVRYTRKELRSLRDGFAEAPDARRGQGRKHALPTVLSICALARLAGQPGPAATERFARRLEQKELRALGAWRNAAGRWVAPSDSTICRVLADTGAAPIVRRFPLVGGIDLAGTVLECTDESSLGPSRDEGADEPCLDKSSGRPCRPGDRVVVLGGGLGETRDGGYARFARVEKGRVVRLPDGIDTRRAMAIGTAGFTAALALHRLERNGQRPGLGPMLVTGATGGVGSIAIDLLAGRGYDVAALTGKTGETPLLRALGAGEVLDRCQVEPVTKPLGRGLWGGAVDNLGGEILAWLTRTVRPWGNIASIGLAAGAGFTTTVMPFILRSVSLIGVNMEVEAKLRRHLWARLATDLRPRHLERIAAHEVTLSDLPACFDAFMAGAVTGRTVVRID